MMEVKLETNGLYKITLEGTDWMADALCLGPRKKPSVDSPLGGYLVASRDSDGKGAVRGFTKFDLDGRVITMKHAYKPRLSDAERRHIEQRLEEAGL